MAGKYGNVFNIRFKAEYVGSISDIQGNFICEVEGWEDHFLTKNLLTEPGYVDLHIDMETGAILNWNPQTKSQIVDLIEKSSSKETEE